MDSTLGNVIEKILKLFLSFYYHQIFHKECVFQLTKFKIALLLGDDEIIFEAEKRT